MAEATRTILFNTKSHLGRNVGIILAWVALSLITIPVWAIWMRKREQKKEAAAAKA